MLLYWVVTLVVAWAGGGRELYGQLGDLQKAMLLSGGMNDNCKRSKRDFNHSRGAALWVVYILICEWGIRTIRR